jgi:hypothetical protein
MNIDEKQQKVLLELFAELEKAGLIPKTSPAEKMEVIERIMDSLQKNDLLVPPNPSEAAKQYLKVLLKTQLEIQKIDVNKSPELKFTKDLNLVTFLNTPQNQMSLTMINNLIKLKEPQIAELKKIKKEIQNDPTLTPEMRMKLTLKIDKRINELEDDVLKLHKLRENKVNASPISDNMSVMRLFLDSVTLAIIDLFGKDTRTGMYEQIVTSVNTNMQGVVDSKELDMKAPIDALTREPPRPKGPLER